MIGFYNYTVILTYISLASSVVGIFICTNSAPLYGDIPNSLWGILCLMISGVCDMFDGKVARTMKNRTEAQKKFGIQIDSLADVIGFGLLPATIGYSILIEQGNIVKSGWIVLFLALFVFFVLAALIRLAYFNVMEEERQSKTAENRKEYEGLPVTNTALIMPFIYIFKFRIGDDWFYIVYSVVLFLVACAFIIKFRVKKVGMKTMLLFLLIGIIEFTFICIEAANK